MAPPDGAARRTGRRVNETPRAVCGGVPGYDYRIGGNDHLVYPARLRKPAPPSREATLADTFRILTAAEFLAQPIPPRPRRGDAPIEYDRTPVPTRGEELARLLWRGRQWAVTDYGIERLDGTYCIEKTRLSEGVKDYGWPLHVTQKTWADSDDFCTAWLVAIALHGAPIPQAAVRSAIGRAYPAELRPAAKGGRW